MALRRHFFALFISVVLLSQGFLLGSYLENVRFQSFYKQLNEQRYELDSVLLEYEYISHLKDINDCDIIWKSYYTNLKNLDKKRIKLDKYKDEGKINSEDYEITKKDYINTEIRYWLLGLDLEDKCDSDVNTILYLYSDDDKCPKCGDQGMILSYLKKYYKDKLLIFSIDERMDGVVDLIKIRYNVTSYPALIINDKSYGFMSADEIKKLLKD